MAFLQVLSKLAFIFNICFLIACGMRLMPHLPQTEIGSLIIVAGYGVAIGLNAVLNAFVAIFFILKKSAWRVVARWLILVNFLFLVAESIYFFS